MKVVFVASDTATLPIEGIYRWYLQETTGNAIATKISGRCNVRLP
jgi:hypothetical protein